MTEWADRARQVCQKLGAKFLIDDSLENALKCVTASPPVPVLLFGDYEWNHRIGRYGDVKNETSFEDKLKRECGREFWREESVDKEVPEGAPLTRVNGWSEVLEWVAAREKDL